MMANNVLILETSTESGSVAIARDGALIAEVVFASRDPATGARTEALGPAVTSCLELASLSACDIGGIVCGAGPGGFTSLRSAAAFAKGICSALNIPLYAVSSLELLAWSTAVGDGKFMVVLDAGRGEWFAADCTCEDGDMEVASAGYLIGDGDLHARAARSHAQIVGPRMEVDVLPRAAGAVPHLTEIESRGAANLDSWEPSYGRLAEAQVKWETAHGRPLSV
jgi:tRNA threonylcarbamoyladenosine biosynthesis protein TsaB